MKKVNRGRAKSRRRAAALEWSPAFTAAMMRRFGTAESPYVGAEYARMLGGSVTAVPFGFDRLDTHEGNLEALGHDASLGAARGRV